MCTNLTITGLAPGETIRRGSIVISHAGSTGIARVSLAAGDATLTLG